MPREANKFVRYLTTGGKWTIIYVCSRESRGTTWSIPDMGMVTELR